MKNKKSEGFQIGKVSILLFFFCLFFLRSFVFFIDTIRPIGMEECHTGAIATEIMHHGFQFPLPEYTPEYYENSIIVEGLLTIFPASLFGMNQFAVELVPFILSFAIFLIYRSVLFRSGHETGIWFFVVSFFFGSMTWIYLSMDSVGNHVIGFFAGSVILYLFYQGYLSRKRKYFYALSVFSGLSLLFHLGSMLYAGLCVLTYLLYRPSHGERPRPSAKVFLNGVVLFFVSSIPFAYFFLKTRYLSVTYLFGVMERRSNNIEDWSIYFGNILNQYLFQFDGIVWKAAFFSSFALFPIIHWMRTRKRDVPDERRLIDFVLMLFPIPVFLAITAVSGGHFTLYYTYLIPLLFFSGAVTVSKGIKHFSSSASLPAVIQIAASIILFLLLHSGMYTYGINLNFSKALQQLTSSGNPAECYWRFGGSFANYVEFNGDSEAYAWEVKSKCGRLDTPEKRNECIWGWQVKNQKFNFDGNAVGILGKESANLLARSIGGWASDIRICLNIEREYIDDCILGYVERKAVTIYSFSVPGDPFVGIPCLPEEPRFTGLVEKIRSEIRSVETGGNAQKCSPFLNDLCIQADAYCAAIEHSDDFCEMNYSEQSDIDLCRFFYKETFLSKEAEGK